MSLSNAERQRRYREKHKHGERKRMDVTLDLQDAVKLDYLAAHWDCSKTEVIRRLILVAWEEEGEPIYDQGGRRLDEE